MFGRSGSPDVTPRTPIRKLPYKFKYSFLDENGEMSTLSIEDWEIGALYWNCLKSTEGEEDAALDLVRKKYEAFIERHDVWFFLGTTMEWHRRRAPNPFTILASFTHSSI